MRKSSFIFALIAVSALAGCLDTDGERALAGAAAGAVVADATDTNAIAGAAIGALAGTYCDDAGICK